MAGWTARGLDCAVEAALFDACLLPTSSAPRRLLAAAPKTICTDFTAASEYFHAPQSACPVDAGDADRRAVWLQDD
jgi:hypothetical protein